MPRRRRKKLPSPTTAHIERFSHEGRGIAEIDGKTTFVFGAIPEETVEITYNKTCSHYDEATATEITKASPLRVTPQCDAFGRCGGCSLQHLQHQTQLELKQKTLLELLQQQGITPERVLAPLTANIWGYRRKARLSVKHVPRKQTTMVGFKERGFPYVTDMQRCEVLHPAIGEKITAFRECFYQLEGAEHIRQLEVAITDDKTAVILRHMQPLSDEDLTQLKQLAEQTSIHLYLQPKGPDSIHLFYPSDADTKLSYSIPEHQLTLFFQPWQFTQINEAINQQMIEQALNLLALQPSDQVLDLFCGIGNFSLPLAQKAAEVVGIEGEHSAVEMAAYNAEQNQLTNCDFHTANLFESCQDYPWAKKTFDKILLDPPRAGAQEILDDRLEHWQAQRIVYVSCNPATLARDAAILQKKGYTLTDAGIMDMFPHTQHVEAMALFVKL